MLRNVFRLYAIAALSTAVAGAAVQSHFTFGNDGWALGELFGNQRDGAPEFVPAGGFPGGYIEAEDVNAYNAFHAPAGWLGNRSGWYGYWLSLYQKAAESDGVNYPLVVLGGGSLLLQYRTAPPGTEWTPYFIPFIADGNWEVGNGSGNPGPAASEEQLRQALTNLQWMAFNADWFTGPDTVGLDTVMVDAPDDPSSIPEPSAVALAASGLVGLLVLRRRRR